MEEESVCVQEPPPPAVPTPFTLHTASDLARLPRQLSIMHRPVCCMWKARLSRGRREDPQSRYLGQLRLAELKGLCGKLKACQSGGCSGCAGPADVAAALGRGCCHLGGDL